MQGGFTAGELLAKQNPRDYLRASELERWLLENDRATRADGRRLVLTERGTELGDRLR